MDPPKLIKKIYILLISDHSLMGKKIPELAFNIPNKSNEMNDIQKRNNIVNNFVNLANFTKHKVPPFWGGHK